MSARWQPDPDVRSGRSVVHNLHAHLEFGPQLHRHLWGSHLWSPSYFAGSVGGAPLSVVKEYILDQKAPDA